MIDADKELTHSSCSRAHPDPLWLPGTRTTMPTWQLGMLISIAASKCCQNWLSMTRTGLRMLSAACGMQQGISFKGRRRLCGAGCRQLLGTGYARATADTPEASSVSSHPSPTTTTARLIAVTKRLAHREHRHERAAARSWLDCQQPSIGARTAAPGDEGRNSSWTPWNFRAAIDAMHS